MPTSNEDETPLLGGTRPLSTLQKLSYSLGSIMNDMCAAMWFSYLLLFLQAVMEIPPALSGVVLLTGQVVDATITPIVGALSDRIGTRRMWHLGGSLLVAGSFSLLFTTCPHCHSLWTVELYYICLVVIFQLGWAAVQISHLAILPDISRTVKDRADLTALRHMMSVCSSLTVYVIAWVVLHTAKNTENKIHYSDGYKFTDIALIELSIGVVTSLLFHITLKNLVSRRTQRCAIQNISICTTLTQLLTTRRMIQASLLFVSSRVFSNIYLIYMPLYLDERADTKAESIATMPLTSYVASFIIAITLRYPIAYCGNKVTYLAGTVACLIAAVWTYNVRHVSQLYGISLFVGAGTSTTIITSLCITANFIGIRTEQGALVYSIVTFMDKLVNGLIVMFIEYFKCESKDMCPHYYRNTLSYGGVIAAFFGIIVLATLANVDEINPGNANTQVSGSNSIVSSVDEQSDCVPPPQEA